MEFVTLKTERLAIRRLRAEDATSIARFRSHPDVVKFQKSYSVEQANKLILEMSESSPIARGKWFQFAVELVSASDLIGDIGFLNTDDEGRSWIGFTIDPKYWNQGYAAEAVVAVLNYYREIGITKVWASTDPQNQSSMKLLKKIGFELVVEKPDDMIFALNWSNQ